ncbi:hypothetical protein OCEANICA350_12705 [Oceanicaulis sp. 350]|nr:hypothetical protein OCEANICA350_12705 [Oceanicaulis sp. 350]
MNIAIVEGPLKIDLMKGRGTTPLLRGGP